MTKNEKYEWRKWWHFVSRRLREFTFLSLWVAVASLLDVYIVNYFPITGPARLMLYVFVGLFDIGTLIELILLLFWPYIPHVISWFGKLRGN